ncbi:MAG: peptidase T [Bdellovibrionales bacterium GWB1_55_8]|nr:MAG: peptidase T [Bdellovibrionales bacterium GWB1_55_8]
MGPKTASVSKTSRLVDRFLKYVRIHSASRDDVEDRFPSTPEQLEIAKVIEKDLREMGLSDIHLDENGYLFATLPSNLPEPAKAPVIGFLAHVDTYPGVSGKDVRPVLHESYDGEDISLPGDPTQIIRVADNPDLMLFKGEAVITTDGTTLLGADDKAGVAEILEAVARLQEDPSIPRPTIRIGFTPDEEVGNGTAHFDLKAFGADYAYTLDGSAAEEIEDETFCADTVNVILFGNDVHPGYARGKMINALDLSARVIHSIPNGMRPETTDGRDGFIHPIGLTGDVSSAKLSFIVRDFSEPGLKAKEELLRRNAESIVGSFRGAKLDFEVKESYRNMKMYLDRDPKPVEVAKLAIERAGLKPRMRPIRGGTDGARLSAMGLLTPNIGGGGRNFHSRQEWVAVPVLEQCTQVVIEIARLFADGRTGRRD